jgi:hypothetical protein
MNLFNKLKAKSDEEKLSLIDFFKSISNSRIPNQDYEKIFDVVTVADCKKIKAGLEIYPEIKLSIFSVQELDQRIQEEKIRQYRSLRPDYKPTAPKRDSGFVAGFKQGYGIGGSGDSSH